MKCPQAVFLATMLLTIPTAGIPCTTVALQGSAARFIGKNYDWSSAIGLVLVNPRGMHKSALVDPRTSRPATWKSRYGSVTFNQYGQEFPNGGMNEAGLVAEVMVNMDGEFPQPSARPSVNELQWIQYQLDRFSTVSEVVAHADDVALAPITGVNLHYMVCDSQAKCATFDYVDGRREIHTGTSLQFPALTNNPYADNAPLLSKYQCFGGDEALPEGGGSFARFARAAAAAKGCGPFAHVRSPHDVFKLLWSLRMGISQWNIVYEPAARKIHFRVPPLGGEQAPIADIDLRELSFECGEPMRFMDMTGDIRPEALRRLVRFSPEVNASLVRKASEETLNLPESLVDTMVRYPRTTRCEAD